MRRLTTLQPRVPNLNTSIGSKPAEVERIRGRQGQQIRERVLRANPLCVRCKAKGRTTVATAVDHITALVNGGNDDPHDDTNRQGLCEACHTDKTAGDMAVARGVR
jgi:5-methylcytosine-specific restriction protein A